MYSIALEAVKRLPSIASYLWLESLLVLALALLCKVGQSNGASLPWSFVVGPLDANAEVVQ